MAVPFGLVDAPFWPRTPIFAPKYIPSPTFFRICFPLGATLLTRSRLRMMLRVSVAYADLQYRGGKYDGAESKLDPSYLQRR